MGRFEGKVAIVTGAGHGIGEAITRGLLAEGARVVANDLSGSRLARLEGDERVTVVAGDITDPGTAERLAGAADADVLFNNAGIFRAAAAEDLAVEEWRLTVDVNLSGTFYVAQAVGLGMIERGGGAIVNVASISGLTAAPFSAAYVASKHGVVGLTKALAIEWARHGVRVNALCPGITATEMFAAAAAAEPERFADRVARVPIARPAEVEEQAAAALWLASDEARYVTGVALPVDGGTIALSSGYAPPS